MMQDKEEQTGGHTPTGYSGSHFPQEGSDPHVSKNGSLELDKYLQAYTPTFEEPVDVQESPNRKVSMKWFRRVWTMLKQDKDPGVQFKSSSVYFDVEASGQKNNTVRLWDEMDERFKLLAQWMESQEYGSITIVHAELPMFTFTRQVKHVTKWRELAIITWRA